MLRSCAFAWAIDFTATRQTARGGIQGMMSLISSSGRGVCFGPRRAENTSAAARQLSGCPTRAKANCGAADGAENLAENPRRYDRHSFVAGQRERFKHDLLDDEAADGVVLCDAAHERLAEPLPMFSVDVADHVHSDLPSHGRERHGMRSLDG